MVTHVPLSILVFIAVGILLVVVNFYTAMTVGKRFDNLLKSKGIMLPLNYAISMPDSWGRALNHCIFILLNGPRLNSGYGRACDGFRFKKYAQKSDFYIAWLNVLMWILILASLLWACGLFPQVMVTLYT